MRTFIEWFLADIITRILYFIGTFVACIIGLFVFIGIAGRIRGVALNFLEYGLFNPWLWCFFTAMSLLSALVGPSLYTKKTNRGRGTLSKVKEQSEIYCDWE